MAEEHFRGLGIKVEEAEEDLEEDLETDLMTAEVVVVDKEDSVEIEETETLEMEEIDSEVEK